MKYTNRDFRKTLIDRNKQLRRGKMWKQLWQTIAITGIVVAAMAILAVIQVIMRG